MRRNRGFLLIGQSAAPTGLLIFPLWGFSKWVRLTTLGGKMHARGRPE